MGMPDNAWEETKFMFGRLLKSGFYWGQWRNPSVQLGVQSRHYPPCREVTTKCN
jgi:hypothetical protein